MGLGIYLCLLQWVASMVKAESSFFLTQVRSKQPVFFLDKKKVDMTLPGEIILHLPKFLLTLLLEMVSELTWTPPLLL